jgi:hypothetical protein
MSKYLLAIGVILFLGCSPTKKIPKKKTLKIEEVYQKISFSPETISKEVKSGFEILVTPIDAKEMNQITFETTYYDGDYEKKQSVSTLIEQQLRQSTLSKDERRRIERKKQVVDFVKEKINRGEIPKTVGDDLMWKLWNKTKGTDGVETSIGRGYPSLLNPYKVNRKYLSVFQLTFKNTSSSVKRIKLKELLFNSGYEQLYPFETSYFEKFYEEEQEILRIIYRLNMPNELVVPPGETVIKYVSIPSLNPTTKGLDVKLIQDDITQSFKFSVNIEEQSQTTLLEEITFKAEDEWKLQVQRYYFVIVTPDNRIHIIKDNSLFLPQEIKSKKLNIYGIASLSTGYTFAKKENFSLNQYQSSEVELEFEEEQKYRK